ncbi:MAG: glycosyltransferase family 39 protein [Bacilli bacterium]|nr:glycosyltransferase family 39 protein [Bacilli bacterium]
MSKSLKMPPFWNWLKGFISSFQKSKWRYFVYFALFVAYLYAYFFFLCGVPKWADDPFAYKDENGHLIAGWIMLISVILAVVYLIYKAIRRTITFSSVSKAIIFIALNAMVYYGFSIPVNCSYNKNDWWVGTHQGSHWEIVVHMWDEGPFAAPPLKADGTYDIANQYYQQKLWHYSVTLWAKFHNLFFGGISTDPIPYFANKGWVNFTYRMDLAFETIKIFQAMLGFWIYFFTYKIFESLGLRKWRLTMATFLFCFLPFYAYLPFIYNNDAMSLMFALMSLYFALRYFRSEKLLDLIVVAVAMGLGMMSKINAVLFAVPIAFIFLYDLIVRIKRKKGIKKFIFQMCVFALIVFPLGLWYPIFEKVTYNEPFGYVLYPGDEYSGNFIDVSFFGAYNRYVAILTSDFFTSPYKRDWGATIPASLGNVDFNIWTGLFKSALFGDCIVDSWQKGPLHVFAKVTPYIQCFWLMVILAFFILLGAKLLALILKRFKKTNYPMGILLAIFFLTAYANYVYFCISFPFTSTMHFRYASMFMFPVFYVICAKVSPIKNDDVSLKRQLEPIERFL